MSSDILVCGALASGRPVALGATRQRLDGLPDSEVAARYAALRSALRERTVAEPDVAERLETLERSEPGTALTRWQTAVTALRADDDAHVVELARDVWVALGANEYTLHLRLRPRTMRGFIESRLWGLAATIPPVLLGFAAVAALASGHPWGWAVAGAAAAWPVVVLGLLRSSYRKRARIGGRELPHL